MTKLYFPPFCRAYGVSVDQYRCRVEGLHGGFRISDGGQTAVKLRTNDQGNPPWTTPQALTLCSCPFQPVRW